MTWIKFHGEIRKGKHRGIPRALRFVFLELAHEARPGRGILELPAGMGLVDGVHDILGGDRREVAKALDLYTKGPDADAPSIVIEGEPGALRLRIPSWEAWNRVDDSAERTREYRRKKREESGRDVDVTRHTSVTTSHDGDGCDRPREEEIREEEKRDPPLVPPPGGERTNEGALLDVGPAKPKRAHRKAPAKPEADLPDGWKPNEGHYTRGTKLGLSRGEVDEQAPLFADHHTARGHTFADWDAAFRTWLGNVKRFAGGQRGPQRAPQPQTAHQPTGGWRPRGHAGAQQ